MLLLRTAIVIDGFLPHPVMRIVLETSVLFARYILRTQFDGVVAVVASAFLANYFELPGPLCTSLKCNHHANLSLPPSHERFCWKWISTVGLHCLCWLPLGLALEIDFSTPLSYWGIDLHCKAHFGMMLELVSVVVIRTLGVFTLSKFVIINVVLFNRRLVS